MKLLLHRSGKRILVENRTVINTEFGLVEVKDGLRKSSTGELFLVSDPWFVDVWNNIKRGPQITHWKDLGVIVSLTGAGPGWRILEMGGGSGYSTLFWSNIVGKEGKVITFENNPRHFRILLRNVEGRENVEVREGIPEVVKDVHMVFADIPYPEHYVDVAYESLLPGGFFVSYLPTIEQVKRLESSLEGFTQPVVHEVIYREWKLMNRTRPLSSGILHTAFVVITRKIGKETT